MIEFLGLYNSFFIKIKIASKMGYLLDAYICDAVLFEE